MNESEFRKFSKDEEKTDPAINKRITSLKMLKKYLVGMLAFWVGSKNEIYALNF